MYLVEVSFGPVLLVLMVLPLAPGCVPEILGLVAISVTVCSIFSFIL
jgi:hypothetical protein